MPLVVPPLAEAFRDECRRFGACPQRDEAFVKGRVIDPVGNHPPFRKIGEIVVEAYQRVSDLAVECAVPVDSSQEFLLFGVHAQHRTSRRFVLLAKGFYVLKLIVSLFGIAGADRLYFARFAFPKFFFFKAALTVFSVMKYPLPVSNSTIFEG